MAPLLLYIYSKLDYKFVEMDVQSQRSERMIENGMAFLQHGISTVLMIEKGTNLAVLTRSIMANLSCSSSLSRSVIRI